MSENRRRRNNGAQNRQVKKARTNNARRILLLVGLMSLVAVISIGGTIAWLTAETTPVTNTFTAAGIDIALTETKAPDGSALAKGAQWSAQLIPGKIYSKDPTVSVVSTTDVDVYLFVKFEEIAPSGKSTTDYLKYTSTLTSANGWTQGPGTGSDGNGIPTNVWYREVKTNEGVKTWTLLADIKDETDAVIGQVQVKDTLTKDDTKITADSVQLKYTAYAIQTEGFDGAAAAWAKINPTPETP